MFENKFLTSKIILQQLKQAEKLKNTRKTRFFYVLRSFFQKKIFGRPPPSLKKLPDPLVLF